jgi:hypothetical protein
MQLSANKDVACNTYLVLAFVCASPQLEIVAHTYPTTRDRGDRILWQNFLIYHPS